MKVTIPGHSYVLDHLDHTDAGLPIQPAFELLRFVKKERDANGNFVTVQNGTTNEEVIACLIDRLTWLNSGPWQCMENTNAILALKLALELLKARTAKRKARGVEGTDKP